MVDEKTRARILKAAQASADAKGAPRMMALPADMLPEVECKGAMHVYPGCSKGCRCKCGRSTLRNDYSHLFE